MKITYSGYNHVHDCDLNVNRPDGSGDYLALLVKSPAIFTIHGTDIHTPPNTFLLYDQGKPQHYRANGTSFANDWFHFQMDAEDQVYLDELNIPFQTPIQIKDIKPFSHIIGKMNLEQYSSNTQKDHTIDCYLHIFFNKISETFHCQPEYGNNKSYDKFLLLRSKIYNRPYLKWDISNLAHQICLSPYYFQHEYKKHFGITCMADVINARMEYAKQLLRDTTLPIRQISEQCGYENDVHFMRQFKKNTSYTPSQYRILPESEKSLLPLISREGPDIF